MNYIKHLKQAFQKKVNEPVLSQKTFYLEDDAQKPIDSNGETITFSCRKK